MANPRHFPVVEPIEPRIVNPSIDKAGRQLIATDRVFTDRIVSGVPLLYALKQPLTLDGLTITDHGLFDCGGVLRAYIGKLLNCTIERVKMIRSPYVPGVTAGIYLSGRTEVRNLTIRDVDYEGSTPITNPRNIYGGITLGGKTPADVGSGFLIERVRLRNLWAEYDPSKYPKKYPNRDGVVFEKGYTDGLIRLCDIRHGSDAGIDRKGARWRVDKVIIEDFRENLKTWTNSHDGEIFSLNPRFCHFMVMNTEGRPTEHVVDSAVLVGTDPNIPIARFENGPGILRLLNADLSGLPRGQVIATADGKSIGSTVFIGSTEHRL